MTEPARRLLGVDFGERRTGLAATDPTGTIVVPLAVIAHHDIAACALAVAEVAIERSSERIIVGLPLDAEGSIGARARRTLEFVTLLQRATRVEVVTCDEAFTTDLAHERLRAGGMKAAARKKLADSVAALVLLERYRAKRS